MNNNNINYLNTSNISNAKCLGPCYYPGVETLHPITLEKYISKYPLCHITPIKEKDGQIHASRLCINPTEKNAINNNFEINILTPEIVFNEFNFLKIYYDIYSIEDSLNYIDKYTYLPIYTKIRIINLSLICFGKDIDIIDIRFVDFIIEYIKKQKINYIYVHLHKNIGHNDSEDKIEFVNPSKNNLNKNDFCIERMNYLLLTLINTDEITKFLIKFFKLHKYKFEDIENHLENIIENLIDYLQNKINISK
jgi:hypothetical protein